MRNPPLAPDVHDRELNREANPSWTLQLEFTPNCTLSIIDQSNWSLYTLLHGGPSTFPTPPITAISLESSHSS